MGGGQNIRYPVLIAEWGLALYLGIWQSDLAPKVLSNRDSNP